MARQSTLMQVDGPALILLSHLTPTALIRVVPTIPSSSVWIYTPEEASLLAAPIHFPHEIRVLPVAEQAAAILQLLQEGKIVVASNLFSHPRVWQGLPPGLPDKTLPGKTAIHCVWVDTIWDSILKNFPRHETLHTILVAPSFPADQNWKSQALEELLHLGAQALDLRPEIDQGFAPVSVAVLKNRQFQDIITDTYAGNRKLSGGMLLAISTVMAEWLRKNIEEPRVGIVLPPGAGAFIVNLACLLAGKTPVNLNFTTGRPANESCIQQAGLKAIITAETLVKRLPDFPWTPVRHDLSTLLKQFSRLRIFFWRTAIFFLPSEALGKLMGIGDKTGDQEAALLFTSGSSGDPKGVILTHRNLLSNISQVEVLLRTENIESMLGCLPIFHSFGFTVTLCWPLIGGPRIVSYISPLESARLASIIHRFKIDLVITTPTFLRGLLRRAEKEELASMKIVLTGAEKLPSSLMEDFQKKFNVPVCEGYGMTEASPVISVNLPDTGHWKRKRPGSTGRMLSGIEVRTIDFNTASPQSPLNTGVIELRGANIFPGYLHEQGKESSVLKDGWYSSGDVGHLDEAGFLHIEGRVSRFSKIGGEMVPHGTVEQHLFEIIRNLTHQDDGIPAAIMGYTHPIRGESLVALIVGDIQPSVIRQELGARGLPNLWIPRIVRHVERIPVLASGKLDLRGCQELTDKFGKEEFD